VLLFIGGVGKQDQARSQLSSHQEAADNAKQALASSEKELEQCDLDKESCRDTKTRVETQLYVGGAGGRGLAGGAVAVI